MGRWIENIKREKQTFLKLQNKPATHILVCPAVRSAIARECHITAIDVRVVEGLKVTLDPELTDPTLELYTE